jgi:hypothetical protein
MEENLIFIGTVIGSASFGAITGKLIDIFLLSRINEKIEKTKWLRQEKLKVFSELSQEITSEENFQLLKSSIKHFLSKQYNDKLKIY